MNKLERGHQRFDGQGNDDNDQKSGEHSTNASRIGRPRFPIELPLNDGIGELQTGHGDGQHRNALQDVVDPFGQGYGSPGIRRVPQLKAAIHNQRKGANPEQHDNGDVAKCKNACKKRCVWFLPLHRLKTNIAELRAFQ